MPTNLPPEYFAVEEKYKAAQTPEEQIELLEELISTIPKHKGTDHLRADLRRRLSRMKEKSQTQKKSGKGAVSPYIIDKEGGGQVALIGYANVGKSTLVAELTNADPEVSPHPYTTWQPTPGMMMIENVQVQVIDTPPVNRGIRGAGVLCDAATGGYDPADGRSGGGCPYPTGRDHQAADREPGGADVSEGPI